MSEGKPYGRAGTHLFGGKEKQPRLNMDVANLRKTGRAC